MQARGLHNLSKFSQPRVFRGRYVNTEKYPIAYTKCVSKKCANLKRPNDVYVLSSKHTYQPMRVPVVSHLFYER